MIIKFIVFSDLMVLVLCCGWRRKSLMRLRRDYVYCWRTKSLILGESVLSYSLSFSIYCQTLLRVLSAGVLCTLRVEG